MYFCFTSHPINFQMDQNSLFNADLYDMHILLIYHKWYIGQIKENRIWCVTEDKKKTNEIKLTQFTKMNKNERATRHKHQFYLNLKWKFGKICRFWLVETVTILIYCCKSVILIHFILFFFFILTDPNW